MNDHEIAREARQVSVPLWTSTVIAKESRHFPGIAVVPACAAFLFAVLSVPAVGQPSVGLVGGVTRDSASRKPLAEAQILAHNLDNGMDRTTLSDADGIFTFTNLEPGNYEVAATKNGFQKSSVKIQVSSLRTAGVELPLRAAADLRSATERLDNSSLTELVKQLLQRIDGLEERLAAMEAKDSTVAQAAAKTTLVTGPLVASLASGAGAPLAAPLPQTPSGAGPAPAPPQAAVLAQPAPTVPDALQAPDAAPLVDNDTPFAFGDFTWLNGIARNKDAVLDTKFFTPEVRFDNIEDFNQPVDHTVVGSTESYRSGEVQIEQISVGGDFHWQNVRGRILTMDGLFATTTPRNDASDGVGQWDLQDAYKYVSEAFGGYHFNVNHGLNVDAGIFASYVGLFSYYNFDN